MRTLFDKPIRQSTTGSYYPNTISLEQFVKVAKGVDTFAINMEALGRPAKSAKFVEEWFEMFLAWSEVEQERE
jgi:hypothetical protein